VDQEIVSQEFIQATLSGDEIAFHSNHEWECKKPSGRAQGLGMRAGSHRQSAPIPYMAPVDPYEKQEKTKVKVKLSDGTNYQMAPFRAGSNEDYVNHIITMIRLIQQKNLESFVKKVFVVVSDIKDKIGPLQKKPNMSKSNEEKESLKKKIKTTKKDLEKAKKTALPEIVFPADQDCQERA
jgi:hypothetical protein